MCDLVGCVRQGTIFCKNCHKLPNFLRLEHVLPLGGEETVRQASARGILTRTGWAPGAQNTARGQEFGTQHWDPRIFRYYLLKCYEHT